MCPSGCISSSGDGSPAFDSGRCIGCGHCAAACPAGAFSTGAAGGPACDPAAFLELCRARRSLRLFTDDPVDDDELARLLQVVGFSPTGVNACGLRVIAVRGGEVEDLLAGPLRKLMKALWVSGPLKAAAALARMRAGTEDFLRGGDPVYRRAPLVLLFMAPRRNPTWRADGIIAASLVMLNAQAMGLACFWNGIAEFAFRLVGRRRLPGARGFRLTAVLCIGHPAVATRPLPPRDWSLTDGSGKPLAAHRGG